MSVIGEKTVIFICINRRTEMPKTKNYLLCLTQTLQDASTVELLQIFIQAFCMIYLWCEGRREKV